MCPRRPRPQVHPRAQGQRSWRQARLQTREPRLTQNSRIIVLAATLIAALALGTARGAEDAWEVHGPWFADLSGAVADPSDPQVAYFTSQSAGVYRTMDGGLSWTFHTVGTSALSVLVLAPTEPQRLYGLAAGGLWRSEDRGQRWTSLPVLGSSAQALAVHPQLSNVVFLGVADQLLRSDDGGARWQSVVTLGLAARIRAIAISPSAPNRMWLATQAGLRYSADGGLTWSSVGSAIQSKTVSGLVVAPSDANVLYASADSQLYRSDDGGVAWRSVGSFSTGIRAVVVAPLDPDRVTLASADRGVLRTENGGGTWLADNAGLGDTRLVGLAVGGQTLRAYAASQRSGVFSRDGAQGAWQTLPHVGDAAPVEAVAFDPSAPRRLLAGTEHGLYVSDDGGQAWQYSYGSSGHPFRDLVPGGAANPGLFYGALAGDGVGRSADGGSTWRLVNTGLPSRLEVTRLVVHPHQPSMVFAASAAGIWKTVNEGATWAAVALGGKWVTALAAAPDGMARVLAGTAEGELAYSDDSGRTWVERSAPEAGVAVAALAIDGQQDDTWYLGTQTSGVWRSDDAGVTWRSWSQGLGSQDVRALRFDLATGALYAATAAGVSVFVTDGDGWTLRVGGQALSDVRAVAPGPNADGTVVAGTGAGAAVATFTADAQRPAPAPPSPSRGGGGNGGSVDWPWLIGLLLAGAAIRIRRHACGHALHHRHTRTLRAATIAGHVR